MALSGRRPAHRLHLGEAPQIDQVDERDSNWEGHHPRFRVYLHGSSETSTSGWTDTYDVIGFDVLQVIDWAQRQDGGSLTFAVALVKDADTWSNQSLAVVAVWCG